MRKSSISRRLLFGSVLTIGILIFISCSRKKVQTSEERFYVEPEDELIKVKMDSLRLPDTLSGNNYFEIDHKSDQDTKIDSIKQAKIKEKK